MALPIFKDDTKPSQMCYPAVYSISKILNIRERFIPYLDYNIVFKHTLDNISLIPSFVDEVQSGSWINVYQIYRENELVYCGGITSDFISIYYPDCLFCSDGDIALFPERYIYTIKPGPYSWASFCGYSETEYIKCRFINNELELIMNSEQISNEKPNGWGESYTITLNTPDAEWIEGAWGNEQAFQDSYILVKTKEDINGESSQYKLIANGSKLCLSNDIIIDTILSYKKYVIVYNLKKVYHHTSGSHDTPPNTAYYRFYYEAAKTESTFTKRIWKINTTQRPKFKMLVSLKNISDYNMENTK